MLAWNLIKLILRFIFQDINRQKCQIIYHKNKIYTSNHLVIFIRKRKKKFIKSSNRWKNPHKIALELHMFYVTFLINGTPLNYTYGNWHPGKKNEKNSFAKFLFNNCIKNFIFFSPGNKNYSVHSKVLIF